MTLVSSIITDAYRESNLIPLIATPSANQVTEALRRLNNIIMSTVGNEAGDELRDLNYGGDYDQSTCLREWLPRNVRLVLNLDAAVSLDAHPYPFEGQRLSFIDVGDNLNTYNVTISGNGRLIEGASSVTLSVDGDSRQWMYRSDTGNWVKIEELEEDDDMPFPLEFDDYFITALAMRLNPRYGQELHPLSLEALRRSRSQLRSRYRSRISYTPTDPGLVAYDDYYSYDYDNFDQGYFGQWDFR
jgi:hypothetical protein